MGRPARRFRDFIGQAKIVALLRRELGGSMARGEPMPHALFTGTSGVGKTQLARALARACQGLPRKAEQMLWKLPYHVRPDQGQISVYQAFSPCQRH